MAKKRKDQFEALEDAQVKIAPGSEAHEMLLQSGYHMTREQAEAIIRERDEKPERWPYEVYERAKAFLAALEAEPEVVSTRPAWRSRRQSRSVRS